jgi:hypothetical protein
LARYLPSQSASAWKTGQEEKEIMTSIRLFALTSLAAAVSLAPMAKADEWNKRTILTVNEAIQLPTVQLQPGTYTFKLLDSQSDRHIVQVFDKDGMHLITTILAIPNYRLKPTGKSEFSFWEVPAGQAPAMRAWFYPGDNFGQEFAYPKNMSAQIASSAKMAVPTVAAASSDEYKSAEVSATTETGATASLDTNTYTKTETAEVAPTPAPEPTPAPVAAAPAPVATAQEVAPTPAPEPVQAPAELPHTASSVPLIGLFGLVSMAGFFALRTNRVR